MPYADANGVRLYYEEAGSGTPVVFLHEFAADWRSWEAQMRWFSRYYRCIAYNARGYPPSDVPEDEGSYDYTHFADDVGAILRHIGEPAGYVVGLSMGAYAALMFGLHHPEMVKGLVLAGCGSGAPRDEHAQFKEQSRAVAQRFLDEGMEAVTPSLSLSATRVQLQNKDPRGWAEFDKHLREHSAHGMALTARNYQGGRPSLWDFEAELATLAAPVLIATGDEDDPCLPVSLFLKRTIPASGLWVAPRTGHGINVEEPGAFNEAVERFFFAVERGAWGQRDPRSRDASPFSVRK
jgi:pimeloyl-ACP methyl ester carboxylesterase